MERNTHSPMRFFKYALGQRSRTNSLQQEFSNDTPVAHSLPHPPSPIAAAWAVDNNFKRLLDEIKAHPLSRQHLEKVVEAIAGRDEISPRNSEEIFKFEP